MHFHEEVQTRSEIAKKVKLTVYNDSTTEMMKNSGSKWFEKSKNLFNRVHSECIISKDWERGILIPINKKGNMKILTTIEG